MGSGGSRLHGATTVRPLFLYRLTDIKKLSRPLIKGRGHHRPCKYKEISSKEDDIMRMEILEGENWQDDNKKLDDDEDADSAEDEEDGEERIIGGDYQGGSSPSFRIFVKSDEKKKDDKPGKKKNVRALDGSISNNDIQQSQECCDKNKEVIKEKKSRRSKSLSMIMPKRGQAAVKNLFNVGAAKSS